MVVAIFRVSFRHFDQLLLLVVRNSVPIASFVRENDVNVALEAGTGQRAIAQHFVITHGNSGQIAKHLSLGPALE